MFTLTMLYVDALLTTHCRALSTHPKLPLPSSSRTFKAIMLTSGAMPVCVKLLEPTMLDTFEPCPWMSLASESLSA